MKGMIMGFLWDRSAAVRVVAVAATVATAVWSGVKVAAVVVPLTWAAAVAGHQLVVAGYGLQVGLSLGAASTVLAVAGMLGSDPRVRVWLRGVEWRPVGWLVAAGVVTASIVAGLATQPALTVVLVAVCVVCVGAAALAGLVSRGLGALVARLGRAL